MPGGRRSGRDRNDSASGGRLAEPCRPDEGVSPEASLDGSQPRALVSAIHAAPAPAASRNRRRVTLPSRLFAPSPSATYTSHTVSKVHYCTLFQAARPDGASARIVRIIGYLGEHFGELVHVRVEGTLLADYLFEGKAHHLFTPHPDHDAGLAVGERLDRRGAETRGQDPVRGRGVAARLYVANRREVGLVGPLGPVYVLLHLPGRGCRALGRHDYEVRLAPLV